MHDGQQDQAAILSSQQPVYGGAKEVWPQQCPKHFQCKQRVRERELIPMFRENTPDWRGMFHSAPRRRVRSRAVTEFPGTPVTIPRHVTAPQLQAKGSLTSFMNAA